MSLSARNALWLLKVAICPQAEARIAWLSLVFTLTPFFITCHSNPSSPLGASSYFWFLSPQTQSTPRSYDALIDGWSDGRSIAGLWLHNAGIPPLPDRLFDSYESLSSDWLTCVASASCVVVLLQFASFGCWWARTRNRPKSWVAWPPHDLRLMSGAITRYSFFSATSRWSLSLCSPLNVHPRNWRKETTSHSVR